MRWVELPRGSRKLVLEAHIPRDWIIHTNEISDAFSLAGENSQKIGTESALEYFGL